MHRSDFPYRSYLTLAMAVTAGLSLAPIAQASLFYDPDGRDGQTGEGGDGVLDNTTANFYNPNDPDDGTPGDAGPGQYQTYDPFNPTDFGENSDGRQTYNVDVTEQITIARPTQVNKDDLNFSTTNGSGFTFEGPNTDFQIINGSTTHVDVPVQTGSSGDLVEFSNEKVFFLDGVVSDNTANNVTTTLRLDDDGKGAGTRSTTVTADNTYSGDTTIAETVDATLTGSLANSNIAINGNALLQGGSSNTGETQQNYNLKYNLDGDANDLIDNNGRLDITNLDLLIDATGTQTQDEYVIADYSQGTLTGSEFQSVTGQPAGYAVVYDGTAANPDSIVLVPEPASLALLGLGGLALLPRRRRS